MKAVPPLIDDCDGHYRPGSSDDHEIVGSVGVYLSDGKGMMLSYDGGMVRLPRDGLPDYFCVLLVEGEALRHGLISAQDVCNPKVFRRSNEFNHVIARSDNRTLISIMNNGIEYLEEKIIDKDRNGDIVKGVAEGLAPLTETVEKMQGTYEIEFQDMFRFTNGKKKRHERILNYPHGICRRIESELNI